MKPCRYILDIHRNIIENHIILEDNLYNRHREISGYLTPEISYKNINLIYLLNPFTYTNDGLLTDPKFILIVS